jgi:hypothetical protein
MGLLLFSAAVLPAAWMAVVCVVALIAVALVARRAPADGVGQPKKPRRLLRTVLGMAVAIGLIVWALISSGR